MKEFLENNGWAFFKTGCSCNGRPRYYRNSYYPGITVVIKSKTFSVRKDGIALCSGSESELEDKLNKQLQ